MSRRRAAVWALRLGLVAALLGTWSYLAGPGGVSNLVLPRIDHVISDLGQLLVAGDTWANLWITLVEMAVSLLIAAVAGFTVALWSARSPLRASVMETLLAWGFLAPLVLFYPIFILWAGIGVWSKISFAVASAFFPIAYNTVRGLTNVSGRYLRIARAFGASPLQTDVSIKLWAAIPLIASGLRIGTAMAVITTILAEMLASTRGIGNSLATASDTFQTSRMFGFIVIIIALVGLLQSGTQFVLKRFDWSSVRA